MQVGSINQTWNNQNYYSKNNNVNFKSVVRNNIPKELLSKNKQNLFIISGPSGVGKGTILKELINRFPCLKTVVTSTTRAPRPGEVNGLSYNFITADEFKKGIESGEFLEHVNVYADTFYGTRFSDVEKAMEGGKNAVLEIDVDGAKKVKTKRPEAIAIFIKPDSIDTLKTHLERRGTETPESMQKRLGRAAYEIEAGCDPERYDAVIQNNDSVEENVQDLARILGLSK